jgi:hypothetical protein
MYSTDNVELVDDGVQQLHLQRLNIEPKDAAHARWHVRVVNRRYEHPATRLQFFKKVWTLLCKMVHTSAYQFQIYMAQMHSRPFVDGEDEHLMKYLSPLTLVVITYKWRGAPFDFDPNVSPPAEIVRHIYSVQPLKVGCFRLHER